MAIGARQRVQFQAAFESVIPFKTTVDVASIASGAKQLTSVTVPGASLGDFVVASCSLDLQGLSLTAYVSAANTVQIDMANNTGGAVDIASAVYAGAVLKPGAIFSPL